ncbi:MAG TPA: alpha/beta family hydrolase [Bacteroidota bacterium]|nr:alpha/beta family hydrolase [Bacteroidota bacterium]
MLKTKKTVIPVSKTIGDVSGLLVVPNEPEAILVLAHGAGAGMAHPFMEKISQGLEARRIATLRYQFPYMERGNKRPDVPTIAVATVVAALDHAKTLFPDVPLFGGGKSFGGRMTSTAAAEKKIPGFRGIVFFGFPLHPPGQPGTKRGEHLKKVDVPMLFLQGTRDTLADLRLLKPLCRKLGEKATLHILDAANHSFNVQKTSGRTDEDVMQELTDATVDWILTRSKEPARK